MDFLRNVIIGTGTQGSQLSQQVSLDDVVEVGGGKRDDKQVTYAFAAKQGRRGNMEDFTFAQFKRCSNGEQFGFFGVFDGHGGPGAAEFVKSHLFIKLEGHPSFPTDMSTALKSAYEATDEDYLKKTAADFCDDGCTGVTAVVRDRQVWVAHVGDSRAILCKSNGAVVALTEDHKPNQERERKRIESEGGVVIWAGTWRVGGVLAVSRAFGDRPLKRYVIACPDVRHDNLDSGEESIILASDGLWDVVSNKEAADMVREQMNVKLAARQLTDEAFRRGSADNISCVVIRFHAATTRAW